jgi:hypothetical protein
VKLSHSYPVISLPPPNLFPPTPSSIHKLRENVSSEHSDLRQKEQATMPKASDGYGGKFGVQQDRMDKVSGDHSNRIIRTVNAPRTTAI